MDITEDQVLFPPSLRSRGVLLAGEYAWPASVVREVIEFLRQRRVAVLGLEVWIPEDDYPRVIAGSEYEVEPDKDWNRYVDRGAAEAVADIMRRHVPPNALFNLTWITELQAKRIGDES